MHFAMAENELERYRETSAVVNERAIVDQGRHMGGTPFGYRRDADKRLVIDTPEAKWVKWIFEQRAEGRGWASMSRELTERGVRQGTGRKLTHHMLRRMVTHRVYLGVAYHGKHVHPDAHPALIDPVLFEAANRVLPGAPPPRAGRVNVIGGLPRCAGCSYVLKPLITRAGDYRWLCRTLLAEQSATYECAAPARIRGSEHDALKRLVVDAAKQFAASVGVETADVQRFEAAQRARVDAEHVLDEVSTLNMRRTLGPERWDKLVREASASLGGGEDPGDPSADTQAGEPPRLAVRCVRSSPSGTAARRATHPGPLRHGRGWRGPARRPRSRPPRRRPCRAAPAGRPQRRPSLDSTGQVANFRGSGALTATSVRATNGSGSGRVPAGPASPVEHLGCRNRARPNRSTLREDFSGTGPGVSPTRSGVVRPARPIGSRPNRSLTPAEFAAEGPADADLEGCQWVREPLFPHPSSSSPS
jgi:hypothetical protein